MSTIKVNILGGNDRQREALAWLIDDYLRHNLDLRSRNVDAERELDVQHPTRLALSELSGVRIDVCRT